MGQPLENDRVWGAAKTAIHAYEDDPSATNAELVAAAVKSIRSLKEDSLFIARRKAAWPARPKSSVK